MDKRKELSNLGTQEIGSEKLLIPKKFREPDTSALQQQLILGKKFMKDNILWIILSIVGIIIAIGGVCHSGVGVFWWASLPNEQSDAGDYLHMLSTTADPPTTEIIHKVVVPPLEKVPLVKTTEGRIQTLKPTIEPTTVTTIPAPFPSDLELYVVTNGAQVRYGTSNEHTDAPADVTLHKFKERKHSVNYGYAAAVRKADGDHVFVANVQHMLYHSANGLVKGPWNGELNDFQYQPSGSILLIWTYQKVWRWDQYPEGSAKEIYDGGFINALTYCQAERNKDEILIIDDGKYFSKTKDNKMIYHGTVTDIEAVVCTNNFVWILTEDSTLYRSDHAGGSLTKAGTGISQPDGCMNSDIVVSKRSDVREEATYINGKQQMVSDFILLEAESKKPLGVTWIACA